MTTQAKLTKVLTKAKIDLSYWLSVAHVSSVAEFHEKKEQIKKESYHKYNDVLNHLNFIQKIEMKLEQ